MDKIASVKDVEAVLTKTAGVCRQLAAENRDLRTQLASYQRRDELSKIASQAVERGTLEEDDVPNFVDRWSKDETPLEVLTDFVGRTPPGVPLARLDEHEKVASADGDETDVLTAFLTSTDVGNY